MRPRTVPNCLMSAQSPWQNKFYPANTIQGNFSLNSGPAAKTVSCNMMNQVFTEFAAEYAEDHGSQAIRIPFSVSSARTSPVVRLACEAQSCLAPLWLLRSMEKALTKI